MKESQIRALRLEIATKLLAGTDVVGGSTNEVNGRITSALLVAEALIKANHETPVTFVVPPQTEAELQAGLKAAFKQAAVESPAMKYIKGKPLTGPTE